MGFGFGGLHVAPGTVSVSVSILTFLGMVIVNKVPHYRVTKLEPHTTDTQVRSGQLQFCHPNSEAPIIARKAIPKLTEMDKLPVLNTSVFHVYLGIYYASLFSPVCGTWCRVLVIFPIIPVN